MVELKVKDIIERKKLLIKGLEENIFKDFTEEEENFLKILEKIFGFFQK